MAKGFSYNINLGADMSVLEQKLAAAKKILNETFGEGSVPKGMQKALEVIESKVDSIKSKSSTPAKSGGVFTSMENDAHAIERALEQLDREIDGFNKKTTKEKFKLLPDSEQKKVSTAINALEKLKSAAERVKAAVDKEAEAQTKLDDLRKRSDAVKESRDVVKAKMDEIKANKELYESIKAQVEERKKAAEAEGKTYNPSKANFDDGKGGKVNGGKAIAALEAYAKLEQELKILNGSYGSLQGQISRTSNAMTAAQTAIANSKTAFGEARAEAERLGVSLDGIGTEGTQSDIEALNNAIEQQMQTALTSANEGMTQLSTTTKDFNTSVQTTTESIRQENQAFTEQNEAAGEVSGLINRIKQFTGLTGAAILMRRALQNAFNTIKELDKQFTEMAVVTDLKVGDYWQQLPQFTAEANALGVAIKDVAAAQTLYYQQGLKAEQVAQLENSTLKMARIAGLDAADATDKMTAALRGFNMEINQTNADRIADVYSALAANTASNVKEISTAMTKTASIAANAGMEFETTAAFLSQIIETTRESAETAGTALKTVIARFQELKKSPDEIGEVDGEIIDANKIETALRGVGVALRDTQGQFRDLDDVFMELAGKWDSLDTNTQRYIATIAAGSRQQSRFIAMMSDYSRTQELVSTANNAAGASNEQFQKTLDSLETKLNKLKNAWDTFTQGLANNEFIKGAIDLLTDILTAINKVTKGWDSWSGSAMKIGLVTIALIAGDKAIHIFMTSMKANNGILTSFGKIFTTAGKSINTFNQRLLLNLKVMKASKASNLSSISAVKAREAAQAKAIAIEKQAALEEQKLNKMRNITNMSTERIAIQEKKVAGAKAASTMANEELIAAQAEENAMLGLSETQQAAYNEFLAAGKSTEQAYALTKAGLTEQRLADITAAFGEKTANDLVTLSEKAQHKGLISLLVAKYANWTATTMAAVANGTYTGSAITATIAQWALNIAEWAGCPPTIAFTIVILALVAALLILVGLILLIVAAFKKMKAESPEGKFKAASEALEKASEVADQAAAAYNDLKESLADLNDKYDVLDDMTIGTQAWRDALLEVNAAVMDLINKYPELADIMEVDKNGIMRINEEAQQRVLAEQAAVNARAQSAKLAAQIAKNDAKATLDYSNLSDKAIAGNQSKDADEYARRNGYDEYTYQAGKKQSRAKNRTQTDQLAKALGAEEFNYLDSSGGINKKELERYMTDIMKMAPDQAKQWIDDLDEETLKKLKEYGQTLNNNLKVQEASMKGMISNSLAMIDTSKYTTEQLQQMANIGTDVMKKTWDAKKEAIKELNNDQFKEKAENYYNELGEDVNVDKYGTVTYKDGDKQIELTKQQAEAQLAAADATDEYVNAMEALPKALANTAANLRKGNNNITGRNANEAAAAEQALNKAFANDQGQGLSRADLNALSEQTLKDMFALDETWAQIYGTEDDFLKEMQKRTELADKAFTQNKQKLQDMQLNNFEFDQSLSADSEKGLVEHMRQIVAASGTAIGQQFGESINGLLASVAQEDRDKLAAQLNAIDWHDADALEQLPNTLKEIGITIPSEHLEEFIADAKKAAHAIHNIDMDALNEKLVVLNKTLKNIYANEQDRTFDDSTYKALIEMAPELASSFRQDLDGNWIYLGSSMDDLREAIDKNTGALVEEKRDQLQAKIDMANQLDSMFGNGTKTFSDGQVMSMRNASAWTEENKRTFIQNLVQSGNISDGVSKYLSGDTKAADVKNFSKDMLNQIIDDLKGVYGQQAKFTAEMNAGIVQAQVTNALRDNVAYNTRSAAMEKAATSTKQLDNTTITNYKTARDVVGIQAVNAGISEADLKKYNELNKILTDLEAEFKTGTDDYRDYAKQMNAYMKVIGDKTAFETMYSGMETNIEKSKELLEAYNNTTNAMKKQQIVGEMASEFGIQITAENYEKFAKYTDAYLNGQEQGFINIINMAGVAAGTQVNAYQTMAEQTLENIEAMGAEYAAFAKSMMDAGYAYTDGTGIFHFGLQQALDIAHDLNDNTEEEIEMWENGYDWLYNANSAVNAQIRERNKLEREYQRMIEDGSGTLEDIATNLQAQVSALNQEANMQKSIYDNAKAELQGMLNSDEYNKYLADAIAVGPNGQITVDKEKLNSIGYTADEGSIVEDMIGRVEELVDTMTSAEDALEDNYDALRELKKTGKDEYTGLLDRVTDALRNQYQKEIDSLSSINDSITEAADALVSKMQEKIDDDRQARADEKSLKNLEDKQTKLAYLQASGGSKLDILKLQKEIEDDSEAYQDKLVDKSLKEMEKANQQAADQRQQQIDIAQAQYDWWSEHDAIHEAEALVNGSLTDIANGLDPASTRVADLLKGEESIGAQSQAAVHDWWNELNSNMSLAAIYASNNGYITGEDKTTLSGLKTTLNNTESSIKDKVGTVNIEMSKTSLGNANLLTNDTMTTLTKTELGAKLGNFATAIDNLAKKLNTGSSTTSPVGADDGSGTSGGGYENDDNDDNDTDTDVTPPPTTKTDKELIQDWVTANNLGEGDRARWGQAMRYYTLDDGRNVLTVWQSLSSSDQNAIHGVANTKGKTSWTSYEDAAADGYSNIMTKSEFGPRKASTGYATYQEYLDAMHKKYLGYATGGLADFTGPAWLDGTKSAPELVLNATDTANFIELKDILSEIMRGAHDRSGDKKTDSGNNYYDIEVHVDSIDSDYDVDQAVERMKELIEEDAMYRNVTAVNKTR